MISPFDASPLGTPESLLGEYPLGFPRSLFGAPSTGRDVSLEGVARDDLEPARKRAFAMVGALSCACPCVVLGSHHSKLVRESPLALRMSRDAKPHDEAYLLPPPPPPPPSLLQPPRHPQIRVKSSVVARDHGLRLGAVRPSSLPSRLRPPMMMIMNDADAV